jgi:cell wall-associated NlpC family hydrolase
LAAQIDVESGWNPAAVSPAGAEGIAQFMPATFATYGRNDDGTGNVSPFNPTDAVMAMGRYDCALLVDTSGLTGQTPVSFMLAAYNAGIAAVLEFTGIPPYPETEAYVARVESLVPIYTASLSSGSAAASSFGQAVVAAATGQLGVPYSWGGGNAAGPTSGIGSGSATIGFDCSGLVLYAVAQASGAQIALPHSSELQATMGTPVAPQNIQPGDVIAFALGPDPTDYDHIGIYIGNNEMIDAPDTGAFVRIDTLNSYWQDTPSVIRSFG